MANSQAVSMIGDLDSGGVTIETCAREPSVRRLT